MCLYQWISHLLHMGPICNIVSPIPQIRFIKLGNWSCNFPCIPGISQVSICIFWCRYSYLSGTLKSVHRYRRDHFLQNHVCSIWTLNVNFFSCLFSISKAQSVMVLGLSMDSVDLGHLCNKKPNNIAYLLYICNVMLICSTFCFCR